MDCGIITEEKEEMVLIPKRDYIRYIENEKTLDNMPALDVEEADSDTEKWKGTGILRIGGKSNGRI